MSDQLYVFNCVNPKGHFGYGHSGVCFNSVSGQVIADRAFELYTAEGSALGVHEAVVAAVQAINAAVVPHKDAGYYEPIRD